ncbi:hypothetical protein DUI87_29107 [Hirundo rustica rustica]|uniref:Uncharacterized protein n=1 Tax=Hirundo rustica rustica TaxID=333673 RepID=A0A3M0J6A6_HIRRU|nr:hypothetical protein DUI87_29107 [Hirundo rustica rustica]
MDFLLPLGAAAEAITESLRWSAGPPPRADDVTEAHSQELLSLNITALYRQNHLTGARPGKCSTVQEQELIDKDFTCLKVLGQRDKDEGSEKFKMPGMG